MSFFGTRQYLKIFRKLQTKFQTLKKVGFLPHLFQSVNGQTFDNVLLYCYDKLFLRNFTFLLVIKVVIEINGDWSNHRILLGCAQKILKKSKNVIILKKISHQYLKKSSKAPEDRGLLEGVLHIYILKEHKILYLLICDGRFFKSSTMLSNVYQFLGLGILGHAGGEHKPIQIKN
ncbi:hypothetical protein BpHYR1_042656 [Brachionus plicatilis]|uniref:Uncharacterized protein n=1 Tax=Brachionus plicatilis TaxID=10195 RepID=A0A3M7Q8Y0_BRAPC|nr:hypothetical protein BpHYR1_042656 [Brachionus plicatilis]